MKGKSKMFIKNDINEVINLQHVLAVRIYDDSTPYEMHLFTDDFEFVLRYETLNQLNVAKNNLMRALRKVYPRWVEMVNPNYNFRQDMLKDVRTWGTNVEVQMVGRNFIVYTPRDITIQDIKGKIIESLNEEMFDRTSLINIDEEV